MYFRKQHQYPSVWERGAGEDLQAFKLRDPSFHVVVTLKGEVTQDGFCLQG